jgi:trehalose-phosphatase
MNESLHDALGQMIGSYHRGDHLVLLFDYDGALTEFVPRPWQAMLPPVTRCQLDELAHLPRVTVGVISGRELDELEGMVGLPELYYAGTDGLELQYQGATVTHPLVKHCRKLVLEVGKAIEGVLRDYPAAWLERKRFGLTVHFRQLDQQLVGALQRRIETELGAWGDRVHVVTGAKAIEITPNLGWTKGTAVEFVLERLSPERSQTLFVGDESIDVEALWSVSIRGGISVGVGRPQPAIAQFELRDTGEVLELLHGLHEALRGASAPSDEGSMGHPVEN